MAVFAHQLSQQLQSLVGAGNWEVAKNMRRFIDTFDGPPETRAQFLHTLGDIFWDHATSPFDCVYAIQYAHQACLLDSLEGQPLKALGKRFIQLDCLEQGIETLSEWLQRRHEWHVGELDIGEVHALIGYALQRQGDYTNAEAHYVMASHSFSIADHTSRLHRNACFLAQVKVRLGLIDEARWIIAHVPQGTENEAYRLRCLTEILHAEGNNIGAVETGEDAAEIFLDRRAFYQACELFLFLSLLYDLLDNPCERDKHMDAAETAFLESAEHRLYRPARLLLGFPI